VRRIRREPAALRTRADSSCATSSRPSVVPTRSSELGVAECLACLSPRKPGCRRVVVKVLCRDAVATSAERFEREMALCARCHHPHVPVLSAGEPAGVPWYTMPLVEGCADRSNRWPAADRGCGPPARRNC
jgi:serine/threonine protein kinase